jgi:hypothetical protein
MGGAYGRIGKWIGIDQGLIKLSGKLYQNGMKIINIRPEMQILNELNRITVLKLKLSSQIIYNIKRKYLEHRGTEI